MTLEQAIELINNEMIVAQLHAEHPYEVEDEALFRGRAQAYDRVLALLSAVPSG